MRAPFQNIQRWMMAGNSISGIGVVPRINRLTGSLNPKVTPATTIIAPAAMSSQALCGHGAVRPTTPAATVASVAVVPTTYIICRSAPPLSSLHALRSGSDRVASQGNSTNVINAIAPQDKPSDNIEMEDNACKSRVCFVSRFVAQIESAAENIFMTDTSVLEIS